MISPDKTIVTQLIGFGLTEREAIVYLTAIESGALSAQLLSKRADINRSSTYVALESLINKGLIEKAEDAKGVSIYEAVNPDTLLKEAVAIEQKQAKIHQDIDNLIPELTALSPALMFHPRVKFYEGKEGVETAVHDLAMMKSGEAVRAFAVIPTISYSKKEQVVQIISPYKGKVMPQPQGETFIRLIPAKQYNFTSDIRIYDNKIVLVSGREEFAVIIEDTYFAEIMKETFDLAWEEAQRLDAQIRAN
ncbi:hypothetical protein KGM48_03100 [Patescibacteria group bacterium]|nr:hypothetical protein [Patescibacteria group bacterium]